MSSTCSVLPRSGFRRGCGRASWRPPSDLVNQADDSGALTDACTRKGPQMANPRPTPKPENLRPPWPPGPRQGWATGFDSFQGIASTSVLARGVLSV